MNVNELIQRWKKRQAELLGMLPDVIRAEFHELSVAIRRAEAELGIEADQWQSEDSVTPGQAGERFHEMLNKLSRRVPLGDRKLQVVEYLRENGPSGRTAVLKATRIPNGSLSNVLADTSLFEKNADGHWQLVSSGPPTHR